MIPLPPELFCLFLLPVLIPNDCLSAQQGESSEAFRKKNKIKSTPPHPSSTPRLLVSPYQAADE